jgi:tetratricopeptide (TPR) repeat protein
MSDPQASNAEMALRWIQHGMRHREQKQWTEALESFEKAISLEPRNPQAWALKGRALDEMNNLSEAIRCYKVSLDINPSSVRQKKNRPSFLTCVG